MADSPAVVQQSMDALAGSIISPTDHAVLGAQLGAAGFSDSEVSNLIGLIERTARDAANEAARKVALSILPALANTLAETHKAAAMDIWHEINHRQGGLGFLSHGACANIALNVARRTPSHNPRTRT